MLVSEELLRVLRPLVGRAHEFEGVDLVASEPWSLDSSVDGADADHLLQDAERYGLVTFQRAEFAGPQRHYSLLRITVEGLRVLGEWPPVGQEHLAGKWDDGHFGREVRPWLEWVRDECTPTTFVGAPHWGMADEMFERWRALGLLLESGLIVASISSDGSCMDQVRLSPEGRHALAPGEPNHLTTARLKLASGNKIEAAVIAVEKVLGPWVRDQAVAAGIDIAKANGKPRSLAVVNDDLKSMGVITEPVRANVSAAVAYRNDLAHGRDELVDHGDVELVIQQVERCCVPR